jgi:hypothetical protein
MAEPRLRESLLLLSPPEALLPGDVALMARAANWEPSTEFQDLSASKIGVLAEEEGIEFATAVLHGRALRVPANAAFASAVSGQQGETERPDVIGIVPGAFHGQHKHTGADGVRLAETYKDLADRVEIVPVRSFGTLEENAGTLLGWLEGKRGKRIALASISKGGADVKWALGSPRAPEAFATVAAWISVSGIVQGTPLVAWLKSRPLRATAFSVLLRVQGHRVAAISQLSHAPDGPLAAWPRLPAHLCVVHVCAFPLPHHLSHRWASRGYARLAGLGPNDGGGILLGDTTRLPGIVCPIWGADHYFQPSWNSTSTLRAIAAAALSRTGSQLANPLAMHPSAAPAIRSTA